MIRAGILGVTGYAGIELLRLLLNHPEVEVTTLDPLALYFVPLDRHLRENLPSVLFKSLYLGVICYNGSHCSLTN